MDITDQLKDLKVSNNETINKLLWGDGAWIDEPDYAQWTDEATGYPCLIRRVYTGALCAYVCLNEDHPMHGLECSEFKQINAHGGVTFADVKNKKFWVGFDCSHVGDLCPKMTYELKRINKQFNTDFPDFDDMFRASIYRTFEYVTDQVIELAQQLKDLENKSHA